MNKPDAADFLEEALAELDALPEGFTQQLLALVNLPSTQRKERIQTLFSEVLDG